MPDKNARNLSLFRRIMNCTLLPPEVYRHSGRGCPVIEQCSIDEAFCDMTGTEKLYGDPIAFATKLKDRIYKELGFTVNIGISTNKLLAKMASDLRSQTVCILFSRKRWRQSSGRSRWNRYTAVEKPLQKDCALLESQPSLTCKSRPPDVTL